MNKIDLDFVMKMSQKIGEAALENDSDNVVKLCNHFYQQAKDEQKLTRPVWRD